MLQLGAKPNGWIKNETFIAPLRLVKMKHLELFTQHRFRATIGQLHKPQGVIALIRTAW
jgi:hypothetical protein